VFVLSWPSLGTQDGGRVLRVKRCGHEWVYGERKWLVGSTSFGEEEELPKSCREHKCLFRSTRHTCMEVGDYARAFYPLGTDIYSSIQTVNMKFNVNIYRKRNISLN
jgi:hypothetical protein